MRWPWFHKPRPQWPPPQTGAGKGQFFGGPYDGETLPVEPPGADIVLYSPTSGEYRRDPQWRRADGAFVYNWVEREAAHV